MAQERAFERVLDPEPAWSSEMIEEERPHLRPFADQWPSASVGPEDDDTLGPEDEAATGMSDDDASGTGDEEDEE